VPRHGLLTHRIDIVAAEIARADDKGLLAHIGPDQTTGGVKMGVVCRFVTHPAPPAVESGGDVTWKRVATGVELLARIRSQLSDFARVCHTPAVVSVFGLGATRIIAIAHLQPASLPPSAADDADPGGVAGGGRHGGAAARAAEAAPRPAGEASRHICVPSPEPEDEALAAVEKPLDQTKRDAVGLEMARSAGPLADVEQEAVRWALAISAVLLLAETWSLDLYPFLPEWAPTVLGNVAEAALTC
jgi:hypothetical protein